MEQFLNLILGRYYLNLQVHFACLCLINLIVLSLCLVWDCFTAVAQGQVRVRLAFVTKLTDLQLLIVCSARSA